MTILEEEKHLTASASSAVSKDSLSITTLSPSSGPSTSCVTSGVSTVSRMTSEVNGTKNHLLSNMISNVADRYITPEYLAPLPSSEKNGKSPLQLLAQTCSQIGADPGNTKLSLDKTKDKKSSSSPALIVSDNASPGSTQVNPRPVSFKPYESADRNNKTPSSVISLSPNSNTKHNSSTSPNSSKSPPSATSATTATNSTIAKTSTTSDAATPVIRSGMEVLAGQPKDLMSLYANPAFRPPLAGYPPSLVPPTSLAASLAAAAAGSLGSSVCRDPYCRDPTCPTAIYNAQLAASLMASGLPPGYAELFQAHKAAAAANPAAANGAGPFICNWNGREGYCGKRHASAEELLQHLRTHTNLSTSDSAIYSASQAANFQRTYGSALSSLSSASRFHPYAAAAAAAAAAKSSALPPSLSGLGGIPPPGLPPGLPPSLYSSAAASSLYASLYGARLAGSLP